MSHEQQYELCMAVASVRTKHLGCSLVQRDSCACRPCVWCARERAALCASTMRMRKAGSSHSALSSLSSFRSRAATSSPWAATLAQYATSALSSATSSSAIREWIYQSSNASHFMRQYINASCRVDLLCGCCCTPCTCVRGRYIAATACALRLDRRARARPAPPRRGAETTPVAARGTRGRLAAPRIAAHLIARVKRIVQFRADRQLRAVCAKSDYMYE